MISYFTFVGSNDPLAAPDGVQGPALDLLDALRADGLSPTEVVVAWTLGAANPEWPGGYDEQKADLRRRVQERLPGASVREVPVRARPNSAAELVPVLAAALERYRHGGRVLHVNMSSGTPQMLEALAALRGTGWFPKEQVRLWQVDRPTHRTQGVPFHREATTPFLEEALRLAGAFAALRRFDFAGAREEFDDLTQRPSELPARQQGVAALGDVAEALYRLDGRDFAGAREVLDGMSVHVPAVTALRDLVSSGAEHDADALVWLTWSRYDRAAEQERVADALIWATILQEAMVAQLLPMHGLNPVRQRVRGREREVFEAAPDLLAAIRAEAPGFMSGDGRHVEAMMLDKRLELLRLRALKARVNVDDFDGNPRRDTPLAEVRAWRNQISHNAGVEETDLSTVKEAVRGLLQAFPFRSSRAKSWVGDPDQCPVSATSLARMTTELEGWLG